MTASSRFVSQMISSRYDRRFAARCSLVSRGALEIVVSSLLPFEVSDAASDSSVGMRDCRTRAMIFDVNYISMRTTLYLIEFGIVYLFVAVAYCDEFWGVKHWLACSMNQAGEWYILSSGFT